MSEMKAKPNPIVGLSVALTMLALASMPVEKGRPIYRRLVDLSREIKKEK